MLVLTSFFCFLLHSLFFFLSIFSFLLFDYQQKHLSFISSSLIFFAVLSWSSKDTLLFILFFCSPCFLFFRLYFVFLHFAAILSYSDMKVCTSVPPIHVQVSPLFKSVATKEKEILFSKYLSETFLKKSEFVPELGDFGLEVKSKKGLGQFHETKLSICFH